MGFTNQKIGKLVEQTVPKLFAILHEDAQEIEEHEQAEYVFQVLTSLLLTAYINAYHDIGEAYRAAQHNHIVLIKALTSVEKKKFYEISKRNILVKL